MRNKFFIYQITNLVNGKLYIGKSNDDVKSGHRWQNHCKIARGGRAVYGHSFSVLHAAIHKYGEKNFRFEIIQRTSTECLAFKLEKYWIKNVRERGYILYNLTDGGEGPSGHVHSAEHKRKIGDAQRGEKSSRAKLNTNDVLCIRQLFTNGYSAVIIAKYYGISPSGVSSIVNRRLWKHLPKQVVSVPDLGRKKLWKLDYEKAEQIRKLSKTTSLGEIAILFCISKATASRVINHLIWK
jgi:predicted GIY-YIG superfamily endonuclease